jgi:hypothetical protein
LNEPRRSIALASTAPSKHRSTLSRTGSILAGSVAALAATALWNMYRARKVEHEHPPSGCFVSVNGVHLHYIEKGEGPPVVLIHGNVVTAEDYALRGVLDRVAERGHRVDRLRAPRLRIERAAAPHPVDRRSRGRSLSAGI